MCCRRELCDEWGCPYLHWVHSSCGDCPVQWAFWANLACPHPTATSPTSFLPSDSDRLATSQKNCPLKQRNYSAFSCWRIYIHALSEHICTLDSQSFNAMFCFIHIIVSKITLKAAKLLKCTQVVQRVQSPLLKKRNTTKKNFFMVLQRHTTLTWCILHQPQTHCQRQVVSDTGHTEAPWNYGFLPLDSLPYWQSWLEF